MRVFGLTQSALALGPRAPFLGTALSHRVVHRSLQLLSPQAVLSPRTL